MLFCHELVFMPLFHSIFTGFSNFQSLCIDDDYQLDGATYSLDYRPIDGDVALPQNSFTTANFLPHG